MVHTVVHRCVPGDPFDPDPHPSAKVEFLKPAPFERASYEDTFSIPSFSICKTLFSDEFSKNTLSKDEPTPMGRGCNNLGTAHLAKNYIDKANYPTLAQAMYIPGQARVYGNIGNDYERAIPHYTEVLQLSRDRSTISTAFHNRGCAYYEWAATRKKVPLEWEKTPFHLHGPVVSTIPPPVLPAKKRKPRSRYICTYI